MGHPILARRADEVRGFGTPELAALLADMQDTMAALNGAGLAAPQIGVPLRVVIFGFDANERSEALMHMIKLDRKRDTLAMNLTYAEQRALEIGITIAGGADVVLLDEPTAGMSKSETRRFIELIKEVTVGKTLLTVEHDMGVVFGLADRIAVLVYGEVIACDTPEKVRANERVKEAYLGSVLAESQAAEAQTSGA